MARKDIKDNLNLSIHGGGSSSQQGIGGGGRATLNYTRGSTTFSPYVEGGGFIPKNGKASGGITGYGLQIRKSFKNGGLAKKVKCNMPKCKPC